LPPVKYDLVVKQYRPSMKIGNDFSDQLMMTEDKTGQDGVNDSDEDGKTYNI